MPLRRERKKKLLAPLLGLPKSIYYKIVVTHQAEKNFGCTTVQGATFNMRGQLYRGHANATALSSGQCTRLRVGRPGF